jgi:hypothetical protein
MCNSATPSARCAMTLPGSGGTPRCWASASRNRRAVSLRAGAAMSAASRISSASAHDGSAELTGEARHHAKWRPLTGTRKPWWPSSAILRPGGPTCWSRWPGASRARQRESWTSRSPSRRRPGGDPRWVEEGRRRAAVARMRPHSGEPRGGPRLLCRTGARLRAAPRSLPPCPVASPLRSPP